jgi:transcription initiation factor TFIID subunit TAF12
MMQQPGIQRPAQFTLEGEGDRVLSKRKLDELVRQVTGTPASDPSSDSHALAPDVEEAVLTLADDFVDNVITSACRLAKLRSSQTLDIRDVQVVLERNYGIRIPGYSLDEVRTVRKFQPAPGWTSKMQAVHGAKVMGGNNGRDS